MHTDSVERNVIVYEELLDSCSDHCHREIESGIEGGTEEVLPELWLIVMILLLSIANAVRVLTA